MASELTRIPPPPPKLPPSSLQFRWEDPSYEVVKKAVENVVYKRQNAEMMDLAARQMSKTATLIATSIQAFAMQQKVALDAAPAEERPALETKQLQEASRVRISPNRSQTDPNPTGLLQLPGIPGFGLGLKCRTMGRTARPTNPFQALTLSP